MGQALRMGNISEDLEIEHYVLGRNNNTCACYFDKLFGFCHLQNKRRQTVVPQWSFLSEVTASLQTLIL